MIRTLLTTTAVALLVSAPVVAQNNAPANQPLATPNASQSMAPGFDMVTGYTVTRGDHLASRLMGQPVYNSAADDAEQVGDINDLVLDGSGGVGAVVIGVGGFLGIGEKNVAVDYGMLQWTTAADGTERLVLPTTRDELTAAAEFVWPDQSMTQDTAASNVPATNRPAQPAQPAQPADQTAAAQPNTAAPVEPARPMPAPDQTAAANPNANGNAMSENMAATQETAANPNAAPIDYSSYAPLDPTQLTTADELIGTRVIGNTDEEIAEVGDIVLTKDGKVDALLIDFGGFLGIGQKRVAVGMDNLRFVTDPNGVNYVFINATRDQLDAAPEYDEANYAANRDTQRLVVTN